MKPPAATRSIWRWRWNNPEGVLPRQVKSLRADLLVMGAYGHSRTRQLFVGSTTTALLRLSLAPVLVSR